MPTHDRGQPEFVAERKTVNKPEDPLIAKRKSEVEGEVLPPEDAVPNVFDELRIRADLQRLSSAPTMLARYFAVLSSRFQRKTEIAVLERWKALYITSKELADAIAALHITQHEQALKVSDLEARTEENRLRRDLSRHKRQQVASAQTTAPEQVRSEDELHFDHKRSRRYLDIRDEIFEKFELKLTSDIEMTKAKKNWRRKIMNDTGLTEQEQDELLDSLDKHFNVVSKDKGIRIFGKD